jgi:N-acetylmuramoyl-L-alanine amidase
LVENTISICLVGDFDQSAPSSSQMTSLQQLVQTLQGRLSIPAESVLAFDRPGSPEGIGRRFPTATLSSQLLR